MGGFNSGGRISRKRTVEDSGGLVLDIDELARRQRLSHGEDRVGTWWWPQRSIAYTTSAGRSSVGDGGLRLEAEPDDPPSIGYEACLADGREPVLRLFYAVCVEGGHSRVEYAVPLVLSQPHFGGIRWLMECPLSSGSVVCSRRVRQLYLPPDVPTACWKKRSDRQIKVTVRE